MLMRSLCYACALLPLPSLQCGLWLSEEAPGDAANHRCHIWHNEKTHERLRISRRSEKKQLPGFFFLSRHQKQERAVGDLHEVSSERSKEEGDNRANCSCCVFNQRTLRIVLLSLPFSFYTGAIIYNRRGGVKYQAHANAITRYLHSR